MQGLKKSESIQKNRLIRIKNNQKRLSIKVIKEVKKVFSDVIDIYSTFIAYEEHCFEPVPKCMLNTTKK